jgi:hypothetical protein
MMKKMTKTINKTDGLIILKEKIAKIEERNRRVEADKAWETSLSRKIAISLLTYMTVAAFFISAGFPRPFINALVPSFAFLLSTLTLPVLKEAWIRNKSRK